MLLLAQIPQSPKQSKKQFFFLFYSPMPLPMSVYEK